MARDPQDKSQTRRFEDFYVLAQSPIMRSIERRVCGCDYGGNSWTTKAEADRIETLLGLRPGLRLLDLGAGSGWPGLRLAKTSGCDLVLLDLPFEGLKLALDRANRDSIGGICDAVIADAAALPVGNATFEVIHHSDLLCCLAPKTDVLAECRRAIGEGGKMVFTVISIAPDLSPADHDRALQAGPEFVEADADYQTLLDRTDWTVIECQDITGDFAAACRRQIIADEEHCDGLGMLLGPTETAARHAMWQTKLAAIETGHLRRELFVARPHRS